LIHLKARQPEQNSMAAEISRKFIFDNQAESLYALTVEMTDHVKLHVNPDEAILLKLRLILVELLTNAVKHSVGQESVIEIIHLPGKINIKKSDIGATLSLRSEGVTYDWPLPGRHYKNSVISIYGDDTCTLKGKLTNNCRIAFSIEENVMENSYESNVRNLTEHFGLMIITRACDSFEYEFEIDNCTNHFIATLKL